MTSLENKVLNALVALLNPDELHYYFGTYAGTLAVLFLFKYRKNCN